MLSRDWLELCLALLDGDDEVAVRLLGESSAEHNELFKFFKEHHLLGAFGMALEGSVTQGQLSDTLKSDLEKAAAFQRAHNELVYSTMLEVNEALSSSDVSVINLKGCYYADKYWGGIERRFLWDVDILVPFSQFGSAMEVLHANGFRSGLAHSTNVWLTKGMAHAVTLEGTEVEVDLHRSLRTRPGYRIDYAKIWDAPGEFTVRGSPIGVLPPSYDLLFLLLAVAHDIECGKLKLKLLLDLRAALLIADPVTDWNQFFEDRALEQLDGLCLQVIDFALQVLGMEHSVPGLTAQLKAAAQRLRRVSEEKHLRLLHNPRNSLENRLWFASASPIGCWRYMTWWATTLPIRYAVGRKL